MDSEASNDTNTNRNSNNNRNIGGRPKKSSWTIAFGNNTINFESGTNCIHCGEIVKHGRKVKRVENHLLVCKKFSR